MSPLPNPDELARARADFRRRWRERAAQLPPRDRIPTSDPGDHGVPQIAGPTFWIGELRQIAELLELLNNLHTHPRKTGGKYPEGVFAYLEGEICLYAIDGDEGADGELHDFAPEPLGWIHQSECDWLFTPYVSPRDLEHRSSFAAANPDEEKGP